MQKVMTFQHTSSTIIKFWMSCCTFHHFLPVEISHLGNITCRKWYFGVNAAAANRAVQWCLPYLFTLWQNVNIFLILFVCTTYSAYPEMWFPKNNKDLLDLLGRHFGCRPLDPTLDIWSNFVKKKKRKIILPPLFLLLLFSKKDATVYKSASFF